MTMTTLLRLNAASCIGFALLFLILPGSVAAWLGSAPVWALVALGAGLAIHGGHLLHAARRPPREWETRYFCAADALWVVATVAVLATGAWVTTPGGTASVTLVAVVVGMLGALQWQARPRAGFIRTGGA